MDTPLCDSGQGWQRDPQDQAATADRDVRRTEQDPATALATAFSQTARDYTVDAREAGILNRGSRASRPLAGVDSTGRCP